MMATAAGPIKRALGSSRRLTSLSLVEAGPRRNDRPRNRCRRVENENARIVVRRFVGVGRGSGAVGASREGMPPPFGNFPSRLPFRRRRLGSSSGGTNAPSLPPLPVPFLEAHDDRKFDPSTHQRNDVPFDPIDGKPPSPPSPSAPLEDVKSESKTFSWNGIPDSDKWCLTTKSNNGSDSHSCNYSQTWIDSQVERWRADSNDFDCSWSASDANSSNETNATKRVLWSNWTEDMVRDPDVSPILFRYDNLVGNVDDTGASPNAAEKRLLRALYQYGLVLITGTPTHTDSLPPGALSEPTKRTHATNAGGDAVESAESAILRLASMIGYHPLQTLYGSGVWSTSSQSSFYGDGGEGTAGPDGNAGASTADSAYGSTSLPLHTDMTYASNPPGAQVFLMVQPAATTTSLSSAADGDNTITPKGQSVYLDGFSAARQLLLENPDAHRLLATTPRRYRCIDDEEGWHLEATGPLIETAPNGRDERGPATSIRHNDLDRLPDLPPYLADAAGGGRRDDAFYRKLGEAHEAWDDVLRRDSMRLVIGLRPGDCVLVANRRCLHGRFAFETSAFPRVVMGCYVGMDELSSKWRKSGLRVL